MTVLMTVYSLMFASNQEFDVTISDEKLVHKHYRMRDFTIERRKK